MVLRFVVDNLLHKFNSGVVSTSVSFAFVSFGGYIDCLKICYGWLKAYPHSARPAGWNGQRERPVAHHTELHQSVGGAYGEVESSIDVGHCAHT